MECWATLYLGYPTVMRLDQERVITSCALRESAAAHGIVLHFSVIESHNSLGVVERYHAPQRCVFLVLQYMHLSLHPETCLRLSLKGSTTPWVRAGSFPQYWSLGRYRPWPFHLHLIPFSLSGCVSYGRPTMRWHGLSPPPGSPNPSRESFPSRAILFISPGDAVRIY